MSDKSKDRTGKKERPDILNAGVVTRGTWAKMQKEGGPDLVPMKEDEHMDRGLQLTSCVSDLIGDVSDHQGESQSPDISQEADGGESPPERTSFSAKDLPHLNEYVVLYLFKKFMKPGDILKASQTCRLWRECGENEKVWELKCKEAGLAFSLTPADLRALERRNAESTSSWKANFLKPYKIAKNFREGDPKMLTIEFNHNPVLFPDIELLLEFSNDKIAIVPGVSSYHIHIFCALSGILLHELDLHTMVITAIQMDQEFLVSIADGYIKVWNVETGTLIHTIIDNHRHLKMHGPIVVSWSGHSWFGHTWMIRMWNVREGRHLHTLTGHTDSVVHVQFNGKFVVSGSEDRSIKIWDAGTGECVRTLSLDTSSPHHISRHFITSLEFNGVHVVAGARDGSFNVWDVETGVRRYTLEGNNNLWNKKMKMQGDLMVCHGFDDETTADIWDISTGVRLHTLAGPHKHNGRIRGFQVSEKFVLTRSDDETVKLWDIKSGEFIRDLVLGSSLGEEKTIHREQVGIEWDGRVRSHVESRRPLRHFSRRDKKRSNRKRSSSTSSSSSESSSESSSDSSSNSSRSRSRDGKKKDKKKKKSKSKGCGILGRLFQCLGCRDRSSSISVRGKQSFVAHGDGNTGPSISVRGKQSFVAHGDGNTGLGSSLGEEKTIEREQSIECQTIKMKNTMIVGAFSFPTRSQLLVLNFDPNFDEN